MATLLTIGRTLLGISFVLDGAWWLYTWDVRAAYLEASGAPALLIIPIAVIYVACGGMVAVGRAVRPASLLLMAVAGMIATLLHTDLGPGGIGEYPLDQHGYVNAHALLVQITLVGALMLAFAAPSLRTPIDLRAVVLGRVLMGAYFVADSLWQAHGLDAIPASPPMPLGPTAWVAAIVIQIVCGMTLAVGRFIRPSVVPLAVVLVATTNSQVHPWFVRGAMEAGLLILYALGPIAAPTSRLLALRPPRGESARVSNPRIGRKP